ncbi:FAD-binding oxidoreductase [Jatrophihabitans telluris]|uniref:FAD-binding oxidoreductase n=1 Tax=Jatrophihabitans telluris TaxID=2038343 RepID=A0ABY4R2Z8_9ACTN|nr:FAD-binding oxidoreductase [Jatrophihabitans telluris]UQX89788.1 FAD-binding oxidoreductase [Jatrophihabitans telluris]
MTDPAPSFRTVDPRVDDLLSAGVRPTAWQRATVVGVRKLSTRLISLMLDVPDRAEHLPGQHYVVRLTADDGYTASRSYSIASAPQAETVELCVERLVDGEVSGYLYDVVRPGDDLEVRGPIGGWFVWDGSTTALGIGGGSGVVPIAAMARHARGAGLQDRFRIAVSGRSRAELPYLDEFIAGHATVALTRERSAVPGTLDHRLGAEDLSPLIKGVETVYVCGSAVFAEAISQVLVRLGYPQSQVRVERFGPTS